MIKRFFGLWCLLLVAMPVWAAPPPAILVVGDSLSAGYGIDVEQGWVALLRQRLAQEGYPYEVVNASISGDTTAGGLARLPAALAAHRPELVLIELGANDGLRGQSLPQMRANLAGMIALTRGQHARAVIFEMRLPPNYGPVYGNAFRKSFADVAKAEKVPMVPFFLGAIAGDPKNFQADGLHPLESEQSKLLDAVWPTLRPLLKKK
ncbi:MAG: arylesterase [Stenotrophobium sp.]